MVFGVCFLRRGVRGACVCCLLHGVRRSWVCRIVFSGRVSLHGVRGACDCRVVFGGRVIVVRRSCCVRGLCLSHRVRGHVFPVWCPWTSLARGVLHGVGSLRCVWVPFCVRGRLAAFCSGVLCIFPRGCLVCVV